MKKNLDDTEQAMRMALGGAIISFGLLRRKWWTLLGLYPYITGSIKYCPIKKFFDQVVNIDLAKSESNNKPIETDQGYSGYRTSNSATGAIPVENPMTIPAS